MAKMTLGILMGLALASSSGGAMAGISYSYVADASSYDVSKGPVTVNVYLQETLTSGSTSLISADSGLFGGGFKVSLLSGGGVKLTGLSLNSGQFPGPHSSSLADTTASLVEYVVSGASSGPVPDSFGRVLLGSVTVEQGGAGTAPAVFALTRYNVIGGNTGTAGSFYDLDFDSASPAFAGATGQTTFTVAVPEPASLALLTVLAGGLLRRSRRGAE